MRTASSGSGQQEDCSVKYKRVLRWPRIMITIYKMGNPVVFKISGRKANMYYGIHVVQHDELQGLVELVMGPLHQVATPAITTGSATHRGH